MRWLVLLLVVGAPAAMLGCDDTVRPPRDVSVTITGTDTTDVFTPARVTVREGDTVVWRNAAATTHRLLSADGGILFGSGDLAPSAQYSFTFTTAGTVDYSCTVHNGSTGTVVVEPR